MKTFRSLLFWLHLAAGVVAGLVILIMSITGALLAFKPQIQRFVDRDVRFVQPPQPGAERRGVQSLVASARAAKPDGQLASIALDADPAASAAVSLGREGTIYVDPYTGSVLGEGSRSLQASFRTLEDWHRWLGGSTDNRAFGRALTGACNLAFLGLAISASISVAETMAAAARESHPHVQASGDWTRARFQLAQRHRFLVRASADCAHDERCGDVVSVGQQPAVPPRGQSVAGGRGRARRWAGWCRSGRGARSRRRAGRGSRRRSDG